MSHKIALASASAAAALTLAVALAAAGFAPGPAVSTAANDPAAPTDAVATPTVQVDTIYLAPPPPQETITIHKVEKSGNEESGDDEHESGEDD